MIDHFLFQSMNEFKSINLKQNLEEHFLGMTLSKLMKKTQIFQMRMIKSFKTIESEDLHFNLIQILEYNVIHYSYAILGNIEIENTKIFSILIIVIMMQFQSQNFERF